ncbi:MAG: hypothetical protein J6866_05730 [Victivallales bacterium]|nr:hypothetical protein [Victivallales bacterium]
MLSWEDDNQMRPNGTYNYSGNAGIYNEAPPDNCRFERAYALKLDFPEKPQQGMTDTFQWDDMKDTFEILSYAAEAWGKPLGIVAGTTGVTGSVNLKTMLHYDDRRYSHSRQFRSNIAAEWQYWAKILEACGLNGESQ